MTVGIEDATNVHTLYRIISSSAVSFAGSGDVNGFEKRVSDHRTLIIIIKTFLYG